MSGKKRNSFSLDDWRKQGFDAKSQMHDGQPQGVKVFVRPNKYEAGRANVVVFNWEQKPEVAIDLKSVLKDGQRFRIVSAGNFHGPAVVSGTFRGAPVVLPMKRIAPAQPVGMPGYNLPVIEPGFGVYVVLAE